MYPQQPELVSTNTWTCESAGGETRITFERFLWGLEFVQPNLTREQREMPGFWIVEAEKSAGRVRFRIHPDVNEYYVKE
jgi:hypothetical protein